MNFKLILLTIFASTLLLSQDLEEIIKKSDEFLKQKNYKEAGEVAERALKLAKEQYGDTSEQVAAVYSKLGRVYFAKGELRLAEDYFTKEKKMLVNEKFSPRYARNLNNLSVIYQSMGYGDKTEKLLLESIDIKRQMGLDNDTSFAKTLNNLGQYYYSIGKYPEAEKLLLESIKIKKEFNGINNSSYINSAINLGLLYKTIGNKDKAKVFMKESYDISSKLLGDTDGLTISSALNLAILYTELGLKDEAAPIMAKTQEMKTKLLSDLNINNFTTFYNVIQLQMSTKEYDQALENLKLITPKILDKLSKNHPLYSKCLKASGIVNWIKGNYKESYNYLKEVVQLASEIYEPNSLNYANAMHSFGGILKEMKEYEQAEAYYNKSFNIYQNIIEKYFPYYSESEKTKFYALLKERYDMFYCYVADRKDDNPILLDKMYRMFTSTKGLLLNYSKKMKANVLKSGNQDLIAKYEEWREKKDQLGKLYSLSKQELMRQNKNLDELEEEANSIEKEISKKLGEKIDVIDTLHIGWREVAKTLKPNEAAIEMIRFKYFSKGWSDSSFYAIMVITNSGEEHLKLILMPNGFELENSYYKNYKAMIKQKLNDKQSFDIYWAQIDELIKDKSKIYVSLDGVYNNISLNTLKKSTGEFVFDNRELVIISNTNELVKHKYETKPLDIPKNAVLLGYPKYKLDEVSSKPVIRQLNKDTVSKNEILISDLPGTKEELEKISSSLKTNNWKFEQFLQESASEGTMKSFKDYSLVHIATHGFFMANLDNQDEGREFGVDIERAVQNPLLRSGLLLSGASNYLNFDFTSQESDENGILTSYEAMNLDLSKTKLVILSACETGLGEVMNGEGVYGLQRALQIAGAKNMIMSLWTVNDQTTQELMTEFYAKWLAGNTIQKSFREAIASIKAKYKDPYYWGAFILIGEVES